MSVFTMMSAVFDHKEIQMDAIRIEKYRTDRRSFLRDEGAGVVAGTVCSFFDMRAFAQNASVGAIVETTA
jgi:hypothetical protein